MNPEIELREAWKEIERLRGELEQAKSERDEAQRAKYGTPCKCASWVKTCEQLEEELASERTRADKLQSEIDGESSRLANKTATECMVLIKKELDKIGHSYFVARDESAWNELKQRADLNYRALEEACNLIPPDKAYSLAGQEGSLPDYFIKKAQEEKK